MSKSREEHLWDSRFIKTLRTLAPGTLLRAGLENILRAKMGALVVVGDSPDILELVDGGFALNCDYSPEGLYELAKMDGAIILSKDVKKILFANTQLAPDPAIYTSETGTRHRTAERVARQTGALVIAISQRRNIISVYLGNVRYILRDITVILSRANQAVQTLERYKQVLAKGLQRLNVVELDNAVTLGDVAAVLIKAEQVSRIAREIERKIIELGIEGRLISMQLDELMPEEDVVQLLLRDYCLSLEPNIPDSLREQLAALPEENLDLYNIVRLLGYGVTVNVADQAVVPRGYRILRRIPRLPIQVIENLVVHFDTLQAISDATLSELDEVEGIGEVRARTIKDGLKQLWEQSRLDRFKH